MSGLVRRTALRVLFRYGWDTRCRHSGPLRVLRAATAAADGAPPLLDVGCGRAGMAAFLDGVEVVGVDLEPPAEPVRSSQFVQASVADLPFPDDSFASVSCIDVLQEVPLELRDRGIAEMLRVARNVLVIAVPQGHVAERCDADFEQSLRARSAPVPPWVAASRANPYPTTAAIAAAISLADPGAAISVSYGERVGISRLVRAAAVRSGPLYAVTNLFFGLLMPLIPAPSSANAYRTFVVVRPSGGAAGVP